MKLKKEYKIKQNLIKENIRYNKKKKLKNIINYIKLNDKT